VVGTVRLILPRHDALDRSLPIQRLCRHPLLRDAQVLGAGNIGEISRLALAKSLPWRSGGPSTSLARLALLQGVVRMSAACGLSHWCALMEPSLLRLLRISGIHFEPIGPLVWFRGWRQPCHGDIAAIVARLRMERPDVWDIVTDGGALWEMLMAAWRRRAQGMAPLRKAA
jgi:N-acyl-L-homoserine lactone synthetase